MLADGFIARPPTMNDIPMLVDMLNSATQSNRDSFFIEAIRQDWETPDFDIHNSIRLVFSPKGRLVAYIEVWDIENPPIRPTIWGCVHPDFEGQGIGNYLMSWAENRAREAIKRCPPTARVLYQCGCDADKTGTQELFVRMGMHYIRDSVDMDISLTSAPTIPSISDDYLIRPYQHPNDFREAIIANETAFEDHYGYVKQPLEDHLQNWERFINSDPNYDPSLWFVAIEKANQKIVGVAISRSRSFSDPDKAYIASLGILKAYRRKGLAMALLKSSFLAFWNHGIMNINLSTDGSSLTGATHLYEKAGMHISRRVMMYEKELRAGDELATT